MDKIIDSIQATNYAPFVWLMGLILFDFITGITAAFLEDKLSSKDAIKGAAKKALMILSAFTALVIDAALFNKSGIVSSSTITYLIACEALSGIENAARCGVPIPSSLLKKLIQLKNTDSQEGNNGNGK